MAKITRKLTFRSEFLTYVEEYGMVLKAVEIMRDALNSKERGRAFEAAKYLLDQTIGRAPQPITGEDGGPVEIKVSFD